MASVEHLTDESRKWALWDFSRDLPFANMARAQTEAVRKIDCEVLDGCRRAVDRWFERRHRSADAIAELSRATFEARSPQDIMEAWMLWSHGAMSRLAEDARDQAEGSLMIVNSIDAGLKTVSAAAGSPLDDDEHAMRRSRGARKH